MKKWEPLDLTLVISKFEEGQGDYLDKIKNKESSSCQM